MDELRDRVERFVREHELIPAGGEVTCLVSGGADSTCLWHLLGSLGYRVSALHVNHKLRGADSEEDARFCADVLGAEVVELDGRGLSEAALREQRRSLAPDRLRATGHTASDQVETILYRLVSRGAPTGIAPRSDDGIVHPLLAALARGDGGVLPRGRPGVPRRHLERRHEAGADPRRDPAPPASAPSRRRREPPARARRAAQRSRRRSPSCSRRLSARSASTSAAASRRCASTSASGSSAGRWSWPARSGGATGLSARELEGLRVRGWRPGDRLAGRRRKIQDVFVDAKVPRSEREAWPLVVRGDEVVAVPGIVEHPEVEAVRD